MNLILTKIFFKLGTWNAIPKPFAYSTRVSIKKKKYFSKSLRNTKQQQIEINMKQQEMQLNVRKLNEFPHFIFQIQDKFLKIGLLKKQIYFNYEFMNAKAKLNDILFINEISNTLWSYYNEYAIVKQCAQNPLKSLVIMHFLYTQNSLMLHKYLNSLIIYLLPKLYDYYKHEKEFKQFIQESLRITIEKKHCQLIPIYNYLPSLIKTANQITMLLCDDKKVECIFSFKNKIFISCSLSQFYIHNDVGLFCTVNLKNVQFLINTVCFTINEGLNGFIIVGNGKNLHRFELNENLSSYSLKTIELEDEIQKILRLNSNCYLVGFKNFIDIYDFNINTVLYRKQINSDVLNIISNEDNKRISSDEEVIDIYVLVLKTNFSIDIYKLNENNKLDDLLSTPAMEFNNCLGFALDEKVTNESILIRFCLLFEKGNFFIFNLNKMHSCEVTHFKLNFLEVKDNFMSFEVNLAKLIDFIDNNLLFLIGRYLYLFNFGKSFFGESSFIKY